MLRIEYHLVKVVMGLNVSRVFLFERELVDYKKMNLRHEIDIKFV